MAKNENKSKMTSKLKKKLFQKEEEKVAQWRSGRGRTKGKHDLKYDNGEHNT